MIDNYDSFTFNLVQYMRELGAEVLTHRNDAITIDQARALAPTHVMISPGPGRPQDAGVTMAFVEAFAGEVPMLGVCLGFQAIAAVWGAPIRHAACLMHGKPSDIEHDERGVYAGVPQRSPVGRYHSLGVHEAELHEDLIPTSREVGGGELMGFRHHTLPIEGVQFHPESVLTPWGGRMVANFLGITDRDVRPPYPTRVYAPTAKAQP
ncbi:MAG: anthranilate synthase component II [Phycisphaerales bacterium JB060]